MTTLTPEQIASDMLETNTLGYWLDICARAVRICDREEHWCKAHGEPVPKWVSVRREEYMAVDEVLVRRLAPDAAGGREG